MHLTIAPDVRKALEDRKLDLDAINAYLEKCTPNGTAPKRRGGQKTRSKQ